ncbi:uncharacterized protein LOC134542945 [Bacillus rossius redtenbacheri]|uniref:uncharacterized protein LOC134542945 n=1 Tax=Bacillus rossius redtenbacheri TaxID=93214 RepID=UPI002FDD2F5B
MALRVQSGAVPEGAVLLEEPEALKYQWKMVFEWKPTSDVWPFTYGLGALGGCTALSSIYINNYYRRRLKLQAFGRIASYFPTVMVPSMMTSFLHQMNVSNDILLHKGGCPVCLEVRGAVIQVLMGSVYPLILAPASSFLLASRYGTYRLPSLTHDFREVMKVYLKLTRRLGNGFFASVALQTIAGMVMVHQEFRSLSKVEDKLSRLEEQYEKKT